MTQKISSVIRNPYGGDKDLPEGIFFSTPKPVSLIKTLIKSTGKTDALVLDYFAGSGTVAHAIKELNDDDGGKRSWILIEEMGSTFHKVLIPRIQVACPHMDFGIFDIQTATVKDQQIYEKFQQYSLEYLSSYHALEEGSHYTKFNMNILGVDRRASQLVALALPQPKNRQDNFKVEVASLIDKIKGSKVSSAIVYTLKPEAGSESPWTTLSDSILKGTNCDHLKIVQIPQELIEEWNQVLKAIAA